MLDRLFCPKEDLQVLCSHHHDIKSNEERQERKAAKAKVKKSTKSRRKH